MLLVSRVRTLLAFVLALLIAIPTLLGLVLIPGRASWEFWFAIWARSMLWVTGVKVVVEGRENIVEPAVFIMNHHSIVDIFSLPFVAPKKSTFVSKIEIARIPLIGWAMRRAGCIFVDRGRSDKAVASLRAGLATLPKDYSILVFPEGTRSGRAELGAFKKGGFHMAVQAGLPIVPVAQWGGDRLAPERSVWIRSGTVHITIGRPISTSGMGQSDVEALCHEAYRAVGGALAASEKAASRESFASNLSLSA